MQQRMFVIDRTRSGNKECPEETLTIAGTTGNLYTVTIARIPSCNCPHALKGNQCKHVVYVGLIHSGGVTRRETDFETGYVPCPSCSTASTVPTRSRRL
jgi:hypothetical protein